MKGSAAAVFDHKEIAMRAMQRAEEIKAEQMQRRKKQKVMMFMGAAAASVALMLTYPRIGNPGGTITIDSPSVPLASIPSFQQEYTGREIGAHPRFYIPVYEAILIEAGDTEVRMVIPNMGHSQDEITFSIVLAETKEVLFVSDPIEPGTYVENVHINRALEKGRHEATLLIQILNAAGDANQEMEIPIIFIAE